MHVFETFVSLDCLAFRESREEGESISEEGFCGGWKGQRVYKS